MAFSKYFIFCYSERERCKLMNSLILPTLYLIRFWLLIQLLADFVFVIANNRIVFRAFIACF